MHFQKKKKKKSPEIVEDRLRGAIGDWSQVHTVVKVCKEGTGRAQSWCHGRPCCGEVGEDEAGWPPVWPLGGHWWPHKSNFYQWWRQNLVGVDSAENEL